jgi:hypothetical protein
MKEQARLREEMNYQYRLGNFQVGLLFLNFAILAIRSGWFNTHSSDLNQSFPDTRLQLQSRKDWILMLLCSNRLVDSPIPFSCSLAFLNTVGRRAYLSMLNCCQLLQSFFLHSVSDATIVYCIGRILNSSYKVCFPCSNYLRHSSHIHMQCALLLHYFWTCPTGRLQPCRYARPTYRNGSRCQHDESGSIWSSGLTYFFS